MNPLLRKNSDCYRNTGVMTTIPLLSRVEIINITDKVDAKYTTVGVRFTF